MQTKDGVSDYIASEIDALDSMRHATRVEHEGGAVGPALILVDVQQGLDDPRYGHRNNPDAEQNISVLLAAFRSVGWAVVHIRHNSTAADSPLRPGQPGNRFKPEAAPHEDEPVLEKHVSSAFVGTGLEDRLRLGGVEQVVIAGLTTNHCVSSTARMAADLGFGVTVVSDATAAHELDGPDGRHRSAEDVHGVALASLNGEFGAVLTTAELLRSLRLEADY